MAQFRNPGKPARTPLNQGTPPPVGNPSKPARTVVPGFKVPATQDRTNAKKHSSPKM